MCEILRFCFEKHGEKRAEESWKIAQSLPGDDSTDTSAADVLCHLYFYCCVSMRSEQEGGVNLLCAAMGFARPMI